MTNAAAFSNRRRLPKGRFKIKVFEKQIKK
jgi:hypothetical protein